MRCARDKPHVHSGGPAAPPGRVGASAIAPENVLDTARRNPTGKKEDSDDSAVDAGAAGVAGKPGVGDDPAPPDSTSGTAGEGAPPSDPTRLNHWPKSVVEGRAGATVADMAAGLFTVGRMGLAVWESSLAKRGAWVLAAAIGAEQAIYSMH